MQEKHRQAKCETSSEKKSLGMMGVRMDHCEPASGSLVVEREIRLNLMWKLRLGERMQNPFKAREMTQSRNF